MMKIRKNVFNTLMGTDAFNILMRTDALLNNNWHKNKIPRPIFPAPLTSLLPFANKQEVIGL